MWYKDENRGSHTCAAVSSDLIRWEILGEEIADCPHEGPYVFRFGGKNWMLTDCWDGFGVYESDDFAHWVRQEGNLLREPGLRCKDGEIGNHGQVLRNGGRAILFYCVHPNYPAVLRVEGMSWITQAEAETVIQAVELKVVNGRLVCDRDAGVGAPLIRPGTADPAQRLKSTPFAGRETRKK